MCKAKGCYQRELRKVRGEGRRIQRICAKLGVLPTGIEKSKGDTKDMCKVRGATNGNCEK